MTENSHEFQAEVSKLLHIVAHSLYSEKEIFLRELVANASDACDKLRYAALTEPELIAGDADFRVTLAVDKDANILSVSDNGIGMDEQDLMDNLGTIARSGTSRFFDQLTGDEAKDVQLIGQFGVGFYSAFMVADKVVVTSRKAGGDKAYSWTSDGQGSFTIDDAERAERGTTIDIYLNKDSHEYLDDARIRTIISTYAEHIDLPVQLIKAEGEEPETLNSALALWKKPKAEVTEEQYTEFYHHVGRAYDDPWITIHSKAEGVIEYSLLLFVPTQAPFDLFNPERKASLKLYVKRIFITDDCEELVPSYLRFLKGIVDSQDLPLNVSREMLQNNPVLAKIKSGLVKKVLGELERKAKNDPEGFLSFWTNFGAVLKEGIYEDAGNGDRILKMAIFNSTKAETKTTLADYVSRMKEDQENIYYITGEELGAITKSPHLEGFKAKDLEVLLLDDAVDSFWLSRNTEFEGKTFKSVTRGSADLKQDAENEKDEAQKEDKPESDSDMSHLIAAFKQALEGKVKDVRRSDRLTQSAVCLVADEGDMDMHMAESSQGSQPIGHGRKPAHSRNQCGPFIDEGAGTKSAADGHSQIIEDAAGLLFDQARIIEGESVEDPVEFATRMADFMTRGLAAQG